MKFWLSATALSFSVPVLSDSLTRSQSDALVEGVRETARTILTACAASEDLARCAEASGIRCERIAEKAAEGYRCVTRATTAFAVDGITPPTISETWEVSFRVFYAKERWNIGPESIGRVVN